MLLVLVDVNTLLIWLRVDWLSPGSRDGLSSEKVLQFFFVLFVCLCFNFGLISLPTITFLVVKPRWVMKQLIFFLIHRFPTRIKRILGIPPESQEIEKLLKIQ